MTTITSIVIRCVETKYTTEYIAKVLWNQRIAQVSNITLVPFNNSYQKAYINISKWCDTEVAYNFIQRLKNMNKETRLVHSNDENWWLVKINPAVQLVTSFPATYFKNYKMVAPRHVAKLNVIQELNQSEAATYIEDDDSDDSVFDDAVKNSQFVTVRPPQLVLNELNKHSNIFPAIF